MPAARRSAEPSKHLRQSGLTGITNSKIVRASFAIPMSIAGVLAFEAFMGDSLF